MDCYAWAPLADNVNSSLTKGMRVIVRGQLERETWQTAEGENRSRIRLRTEDIGPSLLYQTANISKSVRQSDSVFPSSFQNQPANSAENSGINSANDSNRSNEANSQMPTDNPFDTAETNESVSAQGGSNINIVSPKAEDSDEWSVFDDTSADSNTSNSDISNPKIEDSDLKISDSQNENSPNNDTEVFNLEEGNPFQ
jgi:single-stranded DNA-binding protein